MNNNNNNSVLITNVCEWSQVPGFILSRFSSVSAWVACTVPPSVGTGLSLPLIQTRKLGSDVNTWSQGLQPLGGAGIASGLNEFSASNS